MELLILMPPKISSVEIARFLGEHHDEVKRIIEKLAKNGVIQLPQLLYTQPPSFIGTYFFEGRRGQRDSAIVCERLAGLKTAHFIDSWRVLEGGKIELLEPPQGYLKEIKALENESFL